MLVMGLIGGVGSFVTAHYWTLDWWLPATITGTRIGLEDFLIGVSNAGIAIALYIELFHRRFYHFAHRDNRKSLTLLIVATCILFWSLFNIAHLNSFYSCIVSLSFYSAALIFMRHELLVSSLISGLLMVVASIPVYLITIAIFPDFVEHTYPYELVTSANLFTIPIQEFIFYFFFGFMVPTMYEYWQNLRSRRMPTPKKKALK